MGLIAKDGGNKDFETTPSGTHLAICYLLADLGQQETNFGMKPKIVIGWELPFEKMADGRPFGCSKMYTLSLNEKANLRHDLEAWRSKKFTDDELQGFDIRAVLGKPCQVTIVHDTKDGKTYSNVAGVAAVARGMTVPERHNDLVSFDMDDPDRKGYEKLPEWMRKKIDAGQRLPVGKEDTPEFDDDVPL